MSVEPIVTKSAVIPDGRRRGRGVVVVAALALIGALVAAGLCWYFYLRPSNFTAEALIAVLPDDPGGQDSSENIAAVWLEVGTAATILRPVAAEVDMPELQVEEAVVISQPSGVPLLSVTATTSDADTSATLANAVAAQLLRKDRQGQVGHYHLKQLSQARPPVQADSGLGADGVVGGAILGGAAGGLLGRSMMRRRELAR